MPLPGSHSGSPGYRAERIQHFLRRDKRPVAKASAVTRPRAVQRSDNEAPMRERSRPTHGSQASRGDAVLRRISGRSRAFVSVLRDRNEKDVPVITPYMGYRDRYVRPKWSRPSLPPYLHRCHDEQNGQHEQNDRPRRGAWVVGHSTRIDTVAISAPSVAFSPSSAC